MLGYGPAGCLMKNEIAKYFQGRDYTMMGQQEAVEMAETIIGLLRSKLDFDDFACTMWHHGGATNLAPSCELLRRLREVFG